MGNIEILIVEDESRIRQMIKEYLENEGYTIDEAGDGVEGLEKMKSKSYSLALLDVMLPKIDGWSVLREIRRSSDLPVVMLTARGEEYDKLFGFELGVDDYITKPFSPKELAARVKAVLRRSGNAVRVKSNIFEYETLLVNTDSRNVIIDGKKVDMTPKEFELLNFFIANQNKVFTRDQLLNKVWGYEYPGDDRTVDTHIKMLRENLKKYRSLIVTVWGVGYKFELGDIE